MLRLIYIDWMLYEESRGELGSLSKYFALFVWFIFNLVYVEISGLKRHLLIWSQSNCLILGVLVLKTVSHKQGCQFGRHFYSELLNSHQNKRVVFYGLLNKRRIAITNSENYSFNIFGVN